ncbi:MAG: sigma-70 family RNA polymerase sigma factor [Phycisphaerales bacterium]|nr:MAG: sigma-70 family RNA polymerase sigma factor [Phycisphaerales bacterium]
MEVGHTASQFKTTSWTLIVRARSDPADLETLLGQYWSPVYAYLRRKGNRPEDAADLTQSFLSEVVLDRDLIGRADPDRGRFRAFLIAALKRFVIDEYRRERGREGKRAAILVPKDPAQLKSAEPSEEDDPGRAFDRQWAAAVLNNALERVEAACRDDGMTRQWESFELRVLRPLQRDCEPAPIQEVLERLGEREPQVIYSMIQTIKRKLQRELREVVAETVETEEEVEQELAELRRFLGEVG